MTFSDPAELLQNEFFSKWDRENLVNLAELRPKNLNKCQNHEKTGVKIIATFSIKA